MIKKFDEFNDELKYKYPTDSGLTFESFMRNNNVDDDSVTEDMMLWYSSHICTDFTHPARFNTNLKSHSAYVTEMLKKTSIELLVKSLNKGLNCDGKHFVTQYRGKDDEHSNTLWIHPDIYDKEKIADICDRMMWVFTCVEVSRYNFGNPNEYEPYINNDVSPLPVIQIRVEPVKSKVITDFIKNNCDGKIYHICNNYNLDRILKSGLRVKGDNNRYRYINNRLYFVCGETVGDIVINLEIVAGSLNAWDEDKIKDDYSILEIDVNNYNIDFYQDGYYNDDVKYIGYCYSYFPPNRLKLVSMDELLS